MKPWDRTGTDEELIELWHALNPKDFYFEVVFSKAINATTVYITPSEFFEKIGLMYEDSMPIVHLLPDYLVEIIESVYRASANVDYVVKDMRQKGFVSNKHFKEFIENVNWRSPA